MNEEITKKIALFTETACISHHDLMRYANDRLNASKRRKVEEHLADCELCSDALEGYTLIEKPRLANKMIAGLTDYIKERAGTKSIQIVALYSKEIAIAAVGLFIIISGAFIISNLSFEDAKETAQKKNTALPEKEPAPEISSPGPQQNSVPANEADSSAMESSNVADTDNAFVTEEGKKENTKIEIKVRKKEKEQEDRPKPKVTYIDLNKSVNYSGGFIENRNRVNPENENKDKQKPVSHSEKPETTNNSTEKTQGSGTSIKTDNFDPDKIYSDPTVKPKFPGGNEALDEYLFFNKEYPKKARQDQIEGTVIVGFIVGKDGKLDEIQIVKGIEKSLDKEALRLVKNMPQWVPAKQNEVSVAARHAVSIKFTL